MAEFTQRNSKADIPILAYFCYNSKVMKEQKLTNINSIVGREGSPDSLNNFFGLLPGGFKRLNAKRLESSRTKTRREIFRATNIPFSDRYLNSTLQNVFDDVDYAIRQSGSKPEEIEALVMELNDLPNISGDTINDQEKKILKRREEIIGILNKKIGPVLQILKEKNYNLYDLAA